MSKHTKTLAAIAVALLLADPARHPPVDAMVSFTVPEAVHTH